jgi:hypothetical protein
MLVEPFAQILAENLENAINKALEIELKSEI